MREPAAAYGVVFHREGVTTTVSLTRTVDHSLSDRACWVRHSLLVNGKPDASLTVLHPKPRGGCKGLLGQRLAGPGLGISPSGDAETQILSGLLPVCLHQGAEMPASVMVIGWGSGITVGAVLRAPVRRVVAVELEREVLEAARHFEPYNHRPQLDRRLQLVNEDGRNFLSSNPQLYDVIISEPSNPWIAGCGNLFTSEFFQLVRERLEPGGVFLQWLQAYEISPENVWSILGTLADLFPSVYVFQPVRASSDLLIVARESGRLSWSSLQRRFADPRIRDELARIGIEDPADLMVRMLAGPRWIRQMTAGAPRNTDDNARIEFAAPKDLINYRSYSAKRITDQLGQVRARAPLDPIREVSDLPSSPAVADRLCWALLGAGRAVAAVRLSGEIEVSARCKEVASVLSAESPPLEEDDLALVEGLGLPSDLSPGKLVHLEPDEALERLQAWIPVDPGVDPGSDPRGSPDPLGPDPAGSRDLRGSDPAGSRGPPRYHLYPALAVMGHLHAVLDNNYASLVYLTAADVIGPGRTPGYPPMDRLLARQYLRCDRHDLALKRILKLLEERSERTP
jgi:spermidine synthase